MYILSSDYFCKKKEKVKWYGVMKTFSVDKRGKNRVRIYDIRNLLFKSEWCYLLANGLVCKRGAYSFAQKVEAGKQNMDRFCPNQSRLHAILHCVQLGSEHHLFPAIMFHHPHNA